MKGNRLKSRDRYLEEAMLFRDTDLIKVITGVFGAIEPPKAVRRAFWGKNKNSKLKVKTDYLGDVFCKGQNYIGNTDVKAIQKAYTYAIGTITGNRKRVAAAAVATLAVGGMGMAGGTAILTGGGALLGLAGSGVTTAATVAVQSSESFVQSECSKLLAFCSEIAVKKYGRYDIVVLAQQGMQKCAEELRTEIEELSNKENKPDKKLISQMKKSLKCMERCEKALEKLQDSWKLLD